MLKVRKLTFFAGPRPDVGHLVVDVPTVTVFVGPNNSGKSLALREIEISCCGLGDQKEVVSEVDIVWPSDASEAISLLKKYKTDPPEGQKEPDDGFWIGLPTFRTRTPVLHNRIQTRQVKQAIESKQDGFLRNLLGPMYTVRLDGRTRFSLSDPKPSGDLLKHPQNHLAALFQNDAARERVREFTKEAFGIYFTIDPTHVGHFRVRMSRRPPTSITEEQALDDNARQFHKEASIISDLSDGVQAFTGLVSAILSLPHGNILIDEPEAFLHPTLARRLGRDLSQVATERNASLVVATHSSEFLMGCIETTPSLRIIRLTYEKDVATSRSIEPESLQQLMREPLLRSAQALRGLFHRCVIVTEADRDRAFYEEINFRLEEQHRGISDGIFLNAQNWQTISKVVKPLRELGIPAAAIMDLGVVADDSGKSWDQIYDMLNVPQEDRSAFERTRSMVKGDLADCLEADGRKTHNVKGIQTLSGERQRQLQHLMEGLSAYGLFLVPVGELERWLSELRVKADPKSTWLTRIFEALGSDPNQTDYVKPGANDVWTFLESIRNWVDNPRRCGLQ